MLPPYSARGNPRFPLLPKGVSSFSGASGPWGGGGSRSLWRGTSRPGLQLEFGCGRQGVALLVGGLCKDMWKPGWTLCVVVKSLTCTPPPRWSLPASWPCKESTVLLSERIKNGLNGSKLSGLGTVGSGGPGLLSRPCRKRRPSAREDGGVSGLSSSCGARGGFLPRHDEDLGEPLVRRAYTNRHIWLYNPWRINIFMKNFKMNKLCHLKWNSDGLISTGTLIRKQADISKEINVLLIQ